MRELLRFAQADDGGIAFERMHVPVERLEGVGLAFAVLQSLLHDAQGDAHRAERLVALGVKIVQQFRSELG